MLRLRTISLEEVAIPVEVTEIEVLVCTRRIGNDPGTLGILYHIIAAGFQHCHLLV